MTNDMGEIRAYLKKRYSPEFVKGKPERQLWAIYRSCISRDRNKNQMDGQLSIFDFIKEEQ